jgi:KfrB protein
MQTMTRILVMNGTRFVQEGGPKEWTNLKVDQAKGIPPGIYNLSAAKAPGDASVQGVAIHQDAENYYILSGKTIYGVDRSKVANTPPIGEHVTLKSRAEGKPIFEMATSNLSAKRPRRI